MKRFTIKVIGDVTIETESPVCSEMLTITEPFSARLDLAYPDGFLGDSFETLQNQVKVAIRLAMRELSGAATRESFE